MVNQPNRNVLTVFIASPGDLSEERRFTREVAHELNEILSPHVGWDIKVLGSEEVLPGAGRPQEQINKELVDKCDLFIGLLWKRWGSPTGEYTSGFEEEFECARKRNAETGSPEIWLCFKTVDPALIEDAGQQLQKVLEFQKKQIHSKEFLFKEFSDAEDWKKKLKPWLSKYIRELNQDFTDNSKSKPDEEKSLPPETQTIYLPSVNKTGKTGNHGYNQLTELLNVLNQAINNNQLNPISAETPDRFNIARLALLAKTWMSLSYPNELLGVQEINLLYQYKEQLETTAQEWILLLRTLIHDPYDTTVGWYWFQRHSSQDIAVEDLLLVVGKGDKNADIRKRALQLLESTKICLTEDSSKRQDIREIILMDESAIVRKAGLAYLGTTGTREDILITQSALGDDDLSVHSEAALARQSIIVRYDPNEVFHEILEQNIAFETIISEIEEKANEIKTDLLYMAIKHQDSTIRRLAIRELAQRNKVSKQQLFDLLEDESNEIKKMSYQTLVQQGIEIDLEQAKQDLGLSAFQDITLSIYKLLPYERLLEKIDWFSIDSSVAYRVLALDHFSRLSEHIRSNLKNNFECLRQESRKNLYTKYKEDDDVVDRLITELIQHDNFIRNEFIASALAGLALHGKPQDIHWGRHYLRGADSEIQLEAIRIIEHFGDDSDVAALIDIAKESYGELKNLAASAALKLAPGISGAAQQLLKTNNSNLVGLVIQSFWNEEKAEVFPVLQPFLGDNNKSIRLKVLVYFRKVCSDDELEELLLKYLQRPTYFYDVVCWLDRILYAPAPLNDMFLSQLELNTK